VLRKVLPELKVLEALELKGLFIEFD